MGLIFISFCKILYRKSGLKKCVKGVEALGEWRWGEGRGPSDQNLIILVKKVTAMPQLVKLINWVVPECQV